MRPAKLLNRHLVERLVRLTRDIQTREPTQFRKGDLMVVTGAWRGAFTLTRVSEQDPGIKTKANIRGCHRSDFELAHPAAGEQP